MNNLRTIRQSENVSQWKLAKDSGVHQSRISLLENDLVTPTKKEIKSISKALVAVPEEIFGLDVVATRLAASEKNENK